MKKVKFFLAYELNDANKQDLKRAISDACEGTVMEPVFPEERIDPGRPIFYKVSEYIGSTEFGLYHLSSSKEVTDLNANVILELGIGWGFNKDCYIIVEKTKAKNILDQVSDLKGFDRIEYSGFENLKKQLKEKIFIKYQQIHPACQNFWRPFINDGGKIIIGSQTKDLEDGYKRNIIGKEDDVASSELQSFLLSAAKLMVVKNRKIEVQHLPMPEEGDRRKDKILVKNYIKSIENVLFQDGTDNYILIGSPSVNPATELILSKLINVKPFDVDSREKLKTGFFFNDKKRNTYSTFYRHEERKEGIWNAQLNKGLPFNHQEGKSCGIILKTEIEGKKFYILSGFNGVATRAAISLLTDNINADRVEYLNNYLNEGKGVIGVLYRVAFESIKENNKPFELNFLPEQATLEFNISELELYE